MASCDLQTLIAQSNCFACLLPGQAMAVRLQLLCEILQGGGSSGQTCLVRVADSGSPTVASTCDAAIAYNAQGQFWYWQPLTSQWIPFIV